MIGTVTCGAATTLAAVACDAVTVLSSARACATVAVVVTVTLREIGNCVAPAPCLKATPRLIQAEPVGLSVQLVDCAAAADTAL